MRIRHQLILFMLLRTILNTAHRMVYPFLLTFARGLGVDIASMSYLMTARSLIGATSPFFAPVADRRGRRFGMLAGFAIFTLGVGMAAIYPNFYTLAAAVILAMLGKYMFDPSMQAYFGDRVPYAQRGTALAVTEFAWSAAFIAGVPFMAFLIGKYGWSAPFPALTFLGLAAFIAIWKFIPREDSHHVPTSDWRGNYRMVLTSVTALAGISVALWASAANEMVNMMFAVWLEDSFGLQLAAIAGASAVIGISELSGEGLVAFTTDKLGKPLALSIGLISNALASLLLPLIGQTQTGALIGLFLFYITFEYIMVSHVPLMTELAPTARATMLAMNVTGHSIGRAIGAFCAPIAYAQFGFTSVALAAVLFNLAGLLALRRMQRAG